MKGLQDARNRWTYLFGNHKTLASLKESTLDLKNAQDVAGKRSLRSLYWKLFLVLPEFEYLTWHQTLSEGRANYETLLKQYSRPPNGTETHLDDVHVDPLADDDKNPWSVLRRDEELRKEIQQDIDRTYPDNEYFRQLHVQQSMLNVLFVWCKLNPGISYRQGMHEILAPLFWVVEGDSISPESLEDVDIHEDEILVGDAVLKENEERAMLDALDYRYAEHDSFMLFQKVMKRAMTWYLVSDDARGTSSGNSPIVEMSRHIHEDLLDELDPEVAKHLKDMDVLPQVFLIRWIRLMFGREFQFVECLVLWDGIFAQDPNLEIVEYICVAMLLRVRWKLLESDYSTALTLLLRYPSPSPQNPPLSFLLDALHLQSDPTESCGRHIIKKYSNKAPSGKPASSRGRRPSTPEIVEPPDIESTSPRSPRSLPSVPAIKFENFLQTVYDRSEKWGVNKAFKDAAGEVRRISQTVGEQQRDFAKRWTASEERSKTLAALLTLSMDELRSEVVPNEKTKKTLDRLRYVRDFLAENRTEVDEKWLSQVLPAKSKPSTKTSQDAKITGKQQPPMASPERQATASSNSTTYNRDQPRSQSTSRASTPKPPPFPSYTQQSSSTLKPHSRNDLMPSPSAILKPLPASPTNEDPPVSNSNSFSFSNINMSPSPQTINPFNRAKSPTSPSLSSPPLSSMQSPNIQTSPPIGTTPVNSAKPKTSTPRKHLADSPFAFILGDANKPLFMGGGKSGTGGNSGAGEGRRGSLFGGDDQENGAGTEEGIFGAGDERKRSIVGKGGLF